MLAVVARHVFYNNSQFDANDPDITRADDDAIDSTKSPLLPGQTASAANYTNCSRGINGIMVDIAGLPDPLALSVDDFFFRIGNSESPGTWTPAPAPSGFQVRIGDGENESDRVTITWEDGAIKNTWLMVALLATVDLGSSFSQQTSSDVFYVGSAVGDTGNSSLNLQVDGYDFALVRDHLHGTNDPVGIHSTTDFNKDTLVDAADLAIARDGASNFATATKVITGPHLSVAVGSFMEEVEYLWRHKVLPKETNSFTLPNAEQYSLLRQLAFDLIQGDVVQAGTAAVSLNYELVLFVQRPDPTHSDPDMREGDSFYELKEDFDMGNRGWGHYFVDPSADVKTLIEVPHPKSDLRTWQIGGEVFQRSASAGFLTAGAHRDACVFDDSLGQCTADLADAARLEESAFQAIHEGMTGPAGEHPVLQIHGYDRDKSQHSAFRDIADVVLSNGAGSVKPFMKSLDAHLEGMPSTPESSYQFRSFAYVLAGEDDCGLNGEVDGTAFRSLGATENKQGQFTRSVDGTFVHVEVEADIRRGVTNDHRPRVIGGLVSAIKSALS